MFSREEIVKIVDRLGLPGSQFEFVSKKANLTSQRSAFITERVKHDLIELDRLEQILNETAATANFAIVKADVLVYAERQKTYGILSEILRVSRRVAQMLEITANFSYLEEQLALLGAPPTSSKIVGRTSRS